MSLEELYHATQIHHHRLYRFYELLDRWDPMDEELVQLDRRVEEFLQFLGLSSSQEARLAAITRIVNLHEAPLLQLIGNFDEERRITIRRKASAWVGHFYEASFQELIGQVTQKGLLDPFYARLLFHVHRIGEVVNRWYGSWMERIVHGVNRDLERRFGGSVEAILGMLQDQGLLDRDRDGTIAQRCYSLLEPTSQGWRRRSYAQAFPEEIARIGRFLEGALEELEALEEPLGQKRAWLAYLQALRQAFVETDPDRLVAKWSDVDRRWMGVTTPIQVGHPLEYYEDRYRKAVVPEWDLRLQDPEAPGSLQLKRIRNFFATFYRQIGIDAPSIYRQTMAILDRTQLYVGRPMLFYGAGLDGLFSAQVVPNDEGVSRHLGKKIFAYPDLLYQSKRRRPMMRLERELYGPALVQHFRQIFDEPQKWYEVYEITTIGHELGHILWIDEESEGAMNRSGQFKNLEEFKATLGGILAHIHHEADRLWEPLLHDTLTRAISLIHWMEIPEVEPYYVEGLLHLEGLFAAGIVRFDGRQPSFDLSHHRYQTLGRWYEEIYQEIAKCYLVKEDSKKFLDRFIVYGSPIVPRNQEVRAFVEYYYGLYRQFGTQVA
ncbi:MAG: invasion protein [Nitratiruptor sp.]|nr:invasion protein [Nitratiruptor sp.]NPA83842.1 invasion protein CiaB [Campylobacterota bacterium]